MVEDELGGEAGDPVTRASAMFAAGAVVRLVTALRDADIVDDYLIGELSAVAEKCGAELGDDAVKAMAVVRAALGEPGRREKLRQAAADEAEAAEDAAEEADADDEEEAEMEDEPARAG